MSKQDQKNTQAQKISQVVVCLAFSMPWLYAQDHAVSITVFSLCQSMFCLAICCLVFSINKLGQINSEHHANSALQNGSFVLPILFALVGVGLVNTGMVLSPLLGIVLTRLDEPYAVHLHAWGALQQRNLFASLTALSLLAILMLWRVQHMRNDCSEGHPVRSKLVMACTVLSILLLAIGNSISSSRVGALLWCVICVVSLCIFNNSKQIKSFAVIALMSYLAANLILLGEHARSLFPDVGLHTRLHDDNAFSRFSLWANVTELIERSPLFGHGWRSLAYMHYATDFSGARFMEMLDNAHNLPLHLAVELGIPVALAVCALVLWLIWKSKPWAEKRAERQLAWGILMVIGIHSLVEYPLWYGPFLMTAVMAVGILCADTWRNWLLAQANSTRRATLLGVCGCAALLMACTAFAVFDYHRVSQIYLQPEERSSWYKADPLAAAKKSVLFQSHAQFAELQITPLSMASAPRVFVLSDALVRWSPEPRIIEKLIESAVMLGRDDVAVFHLKRYKVAYPQAYAAWSQRER